MNILNKLLCVIVTVILASCTGRNAVTRQCIPYVSKVLSDTSVAGYHLLRSFDDGDVTGVIAVIGSPVECILMSEKLVTGDDFENVDGSRNKDGLPDFAGETVNSFIDLANVPYSAFTEKGIEDSLRTVAVKNLLTAIDTSFRINSFNNINRLRKLPAKMVVFTSPEVCAYCRFDVDTLLHAVGKDLPVVWATESMFNQALKGRGGSQRVGVLANGKSLATGSYSAVFSSVASSLGDSSSKMYIFSPDSGVSASSKFLRFLDMYMSAGNTGRLNSMLIDDPSVPVDSLNMVLEEVKAAATEKMLGYRQLISSDFVFINMQDAVAADCYSILRKRNMFTHNIAYPLANGFVSVPLSSSEVGDGFTFVKYEDRFLSQESLDMIRSRAVQTYRAYVQD